MLRFKEYLQLLEIATDTWLTPVAPNLEKYYKNYKAPTSTGNINLDELPPTNRKKFIDKNLLDKIKNRLQTQAVSKDRK